MSKHEEKPKFKSIEVQVRFTSDKKHRDDVEAALSEFKKHVKKSGIMQDLRRREFYTSPAKTRRLKREESQRQRRRDARKQEWYSRTHNNF